MKLITIISLYAITNAHKLPKKLISNKDQKKLQQLADQHLGQVSSQAQQAADQSLQAAQHLADQYQLKDFDGNPVDVKELQKLVQQNGQRSLPTMQEIEKKAKDLASQVAKDIENYYQDNKKTIKKMKKQNLREVYDKAFKDTYKGFDHPDPLIKRDIKKIMKKVYLEIIKQAGESDRDPLHRSQPDLGKFINLIERDGPKMANKIAQMAPQLADEALRALDHYARSFG